MGKKSKVDSKGANFRALVYEIVKKIPKGRVMTYGQVAKELRINPRMVGRALHQNKSSDVPCHRVVNREGRLAPNFAFNGWEEQKRRLLTEGVKFADNMHVDLKEYLWV